MSAASYFSHCLDVRDKPLVRGGEKPIFAVFRGNKGF
jgi:hypothetical protein